METEFISYLEKELEEEFSDDKIISFYWQINSSRLDAQFKHSYDLKYLLRKIQSLTTLSCLILSKKQSDDAYFVLKICATLLKNMVQVKECEYDKDFLLIIAALCYDISGYQANAYCITKEMQKYILESIDSDIDVSEDNKIIEQIILILQKRIPLGYEKIIEDKSKKTLQYKLFENAIINWYQTILELKKTDYNFFFSAAYKAYLNVNNTYISKILLLLKTKISISNNRLISKNIYKNKPENSIWNKYIKLLANDVFSSNSIKRLDERHSKYEFWISQLNAIDKGIIEKDESFVVQMPTSAGKTFIAELFILNKLIQQPSKHVVYVSPYKALSTEKENDLGNSLEKLGFSVSELPGSYEIDFFQNLITTQTDLLITTPEKIDLLLRMNKEYFADVSAIVVDEGHLINSDGRGPLLEFLLIRLKILFPQIKYLFISAVIPKISATDLSEWLNKSEGNVITSKFIGDKDWEPTDKLIGRFDWNNSGGKITFDKIPIDKDTKKSPFVPNYLQGFLKEYVDQSTTKKPCITSALAYKLVAEGETLVFCGTKTDIKSIATRLTYLCETYPNSVLIENKETASYYYCEQYFGKDDYRTKAIKNGIGVHYGNLPEQIRLSVEEDYKNHKLHAMICTNTIGQGLNFPIKNVIFYTVSYKHDNLKLSKKDFWNIVGRAGRAEKETEGFIIFVVYHDFAKYPYKCPDDYRYEEYTDKIIDEPLESCLFPIIKEFIDNRIDIDDEISESIGKIIDTYLIDLLTEEAIENNFEELTKKIVENSYFNVQLKRNNLDTSLVSNVIKKRFNYYVENIKNEEKQLYSETGLSLQSTKEIIAYVRSQYETSVNLVGDLGTYISSFLEMIQLRKINELNHHDLVNLSLDYTLCGDLIINWINGKSRIELLEDWKKIDSKTDNYYIFENIGLSYLFPWIISSYLLIIKHIYELEDDDISDEIKLSSTFIKYGLNSLSACTAKTYGIRTRELAVLLSDSYGDNDSSNFINWLVNLSDYEIDNFPISIWEKRNIRNVISKFYTSDLKDQPTTFTFRIKGTYFNEEFKKASLNVYLSSKLSLQREINNENDPYAIQITNEGDCIGYVPQSYSKFISTEIDINHTEYDVTVINILRKNDFNEITISLIKK